MTGNDLRRYRRAVGLNQDSFARELGLSQSALSLLERGKVALSADHLAKLAAAFDQPRFEPQFSKFVKDLERSRAEGQAALSAPMVRHITLTVWAWSEEFDLSQAPAGDQAVGLVTVRSTQNDMIAFQMGKATEAWGAGEILVFEACERSQIRDGDVCLVQVKTTRGRGTQTMLAIAHLAPAVRGNTLQLEPLSPPGAIFATGEDLIACMRATFRARYCV
jgi:transcriptional regulator with XRE-family HTH domain